MEVLLADLDVKLTAQINDIFKKTYVLNPKASVGQGSSADYLCDALRDCIYNRCGMVWGSVQREIIEAALQTLQPCIYGRQWANAMDRVCKRFGYDSCKRLLNVLTMRRTGKTMVISALVASFLYTIPHIPVCICSPDLDHSADVLNHVRVFLRTIDPRNDQRVMPPGHNTKVSVGLYMDLRDIRVCTAFAGTVMVGGRPGLCSA